MGQLDSIFSNCLDLISQHGGGDFEGPQDEELIAKAEAMLSVKFPPSFRKFILEFGCGDFEGIEFYGVFREDFEQSGIPDCVWITLNERKQGLPENCVLIGETGDGSYYALDINREDDQSESPVIVLSSDFEKSEIVHPNYTLFFHDQITSVF